MVHPIINLSLEIIVLLIIIGVILYIFKALIITKNNLFTANLYFFISFIALFLTQVLSILIFLGIIDNGLIQIIKNIFRLIFLILILIGYYYYSKLLYNVADGLKKKTK